MVKFSFVLLYLGAGVVLISQTDANPIGFGAWNILTTTDNRTIQAFRDFLTTPLFGKFNGGGLFTALQRFHTLKMVIANSTNANATVTATATATSNSGFNPLSVISNLGIGVGVGGSTSGGSTTTTTSAPSQFSFSAEIAAGFTGDEGEDKDNKITIGTSASSTVSSRLGEAASVELSLDTKDESSEGTATVISSFPATDEKEDELKVEIDKEDEKEQEEEKQKEEKMLIENVFSVQASVESDTKADDSDSTEVKLDISASDKSEEDSKLDKSAEDSKPDKADSVEAEVTTRFADASNSDKIESSSDGYKYVKPGSEGSITSGDMYLPPVSGGYKYPSPGSDNKAGGYQYSQAGSESFNASASADIKLVSRSSDDENDENRNDEPERLVVNLAGQSFKPKSEEEDNEIESSKKSSSSNEDDEDLEIIRRNIRRENGQPFIFRGIQIDPEEINNLRYLRQIMRRRMQ